MRILLRRMRIMYGVFLMIFLMIFVNKFEEGLFLMNWSPNA